MDKRTMGLNGQMQKSNRLRWRPIWSYLSNPLIRRNALARLRSLAQNRISTRALAWHWRQRFRSDIRVIATVHGDQKLQLRPGDVIGRRIYVNREFESTESTWLANNLEPGMVFLDIGANIGYFTVLASRQVGSSGCVHAFEPSPVAVQELESNLVLNGITNVIVNNMAVGNEETVLEFPRYMPGHEAYGSLLPRIWPGSEIIGRDTVKMVRLDDYVLHSGLSRVDVIKLDIEGAEILALQGATRLLGAVDGPLIILELAEFNMRGSAFCCSDVLNFLADIGYQCGYLRKNRIDSITEIPETLSINATVIAWKN